MIPYIGILVWITVIVKTCQEILSVGERTVGRRRARVESPDDGDVECCDGINHQHKRRKVLKLNPIPICHTKTLIEHVNRILGWLEDDDFGFSTIGIYGMGGVGKTILAKYVHDQIRNYGVSWVSVGTDLSVGNLQQDIAKEFGIDLQDDKDEIRRAAIVNEFLSRSPKCVVFVDDLWGVFRREQVGIPESCKLVLVSRSLDICRMMRCQRVIKVEPLPEEEGWQLFCHSIKNEVVDFGEKAKFLGRECGGMPYAINSLAETIRGIDDASKWWESVESLSTCPIGQTILEDAFTVLRQSYDSLSGSKLKQCLLYCALYPKGYAIGREELIRLWTAVKLIDEALPSQVQYDMGHSILNKLLSCCLLESCGDKRVKMHELVRGMALSVSRDHFLVKAGMPLTEASTTLEWRKSLDVVSLVDSALNIPLDASPELPVLSALLMQHNPLEVLPNSFFLHMPSLRILNLSHTLIELLPSSMKALGELLVLDLGYCQNLKQVLPLAKLYKLQFLDLSHTAIGQVPCSLRELTMLTDLNLSSVCKLKEFPKRVLPALSKLKRLSCDVGGTIPDLRSLKALEVLDVRFDNLFDLSIYVLSEQWRTLESFHLQVGHSRIAEKSHQRALSLQGCSFAGEQGDYIVLPDNIQELNVADCRGFSSLSDILNPVHASELGNYNTSCDSSCIGKVHCSSCRRLRQNAGAFTGLEKCTIRRCHDVEKLFPSGWIQNLQQLEVIIVEDCEKLTELVAHEGNKGCSSEASHYVISLPHLKKLELAQLLQLTNIYKGRLICSSVQSLSFTDCPKLNRLPFSFVDSRDRVIPSAIERIEGQDEWWELLQWDEPKSEALLKRLFIHKSTSTLV